ncbi:Transport and Golgi organization 2 homolog [Linum grandiflorum]
MCIAVFVWRAHPLHPFLLLLNRDEFHSRPTTPLGWWRNEDDDGGGVEFLGGRDEKAGGTWLAANRYGRIAFLTNVRELFSAPAANTRGRLPIRFLQSEKNPMEFANELVEEMDSYNGFNLVVADVNAKSMVYITNRPKPNCPAVTVVSPGIHVLSNASLDTPWPKAERLSRSFKEFMDRYGEQEEIPAKEIVETLMRNTIKDEDRSLLPGVYPPDYEYQASSIFVDIDSPSGRYGTRSTSAVLVSRSGLVNFYERYIDNEEWKEQSVCYRILQKSDESGL